MHGQDSVDDHGLQPPRGQAHLPTLPLAPAPVDVTYDGTLEHIEAAGMLIDCDFMRYKDDESHQTSVCISVQ